VIDRTVLLMVAVERWTGRETRALRLASRMTVVGFADHLGVSARAVSKWEARGFRIEPMPEIQAALDTVLLAMGEPERGRFQAHLRADRLLADGPGREVAPVPARVGPEDVTHATEVTNALRGLDYRWGGGGVCEAIGAHARWLDRLSAGTVARGQTARIRGAAADAHNLAGWTAFDIGRQDLGLAHLRQALGYAESSGWPSLTGNVLYRIGRVHLHRGEPREAIQHFQRGRRAVGTVNPRSAGLLHANLAWAYADLGDVAAAMRHLNRSEQHLAHADREDPVAWVQFDEPAFFALQGMTRLSLELKALVPPGRARPLIARTMIARPPELARNQVFERSAVAVASLHERDWAAAEEMGRRALEQAGTLRSRRVLDRLRPFVVLTGQAARHTVLPEGLRQVAAEIDEAARAG
jgi:tetratricopeptide (TPR) repeat protein